MVVNLTSVTCNPLRGCLVVLLGYACKPLVVEQWSNGLLVGNPSGPTSSVRGYV